MSKKLWVLTRELNAYEQDGEYFEAAFIGKPTAKHLKRVLKLRDTEEADELISHILDGGGRMGIENEWYNLEEYEEGTKYE